MRPGRIFLITVFCTGIYAVSAFAIDSIEFLSGYLEGSLKQNKNYEAVPLLCGLHWNLNSFVKDTTGIKIAGELDGIIEPFINPIMAPDTNVEIGSDFLLRYTLPFTERVRPYMKFGAGMVYMTQHTREQSTQFNFLPQLGAGISFFFKENTALNFEYRFRHLSNSDIDRPNGGIDVDMYCAGIEIFF